MILCGGYDTLMGKFKNIKYALNQTGEDISKINNEISGNTSIATKSIDSNNSVEVAKNGNVANK